MGLRRGAFAGALALLLLHGASPVQAQSRPHEPRGVEGWTIGDDAFADLWFHCLAVIGYRGGGALSLYDPRYAVRVRARKAAAGASTALDANASTLRAAFDADSAFELLHFVPLYFLGRDPALVLSELERAFAEDDARAGRPRVPAVSPAARAVAAALPSASERAALTAFLRAAGDEWRRFLGDRRGELARFDASSRAGLLESWRDTILPAIASGLPPADGAHGTLIIVPALGAEGRIVRGIGDGPIVAVGQGASGSDPAAPLFAAVRELSFALVPVAEPARARERLAAERVRDAAATAAGAALLGRRHPELAVRYRAAFPSKEDVPVRSLENKRGAP